MSQSIHLICRREGAGLKGIKQIDRVQQLYRSVSWELSEADAREIKGGWVYMHPSKSEPSYFGGVVMGVEQTDSLSSHGNPEIAIILQSRKEARGQKWRGASHGMAWWSGLVSKTFDHEQDTTAP